MHHRSPRAESRGLPLSVLLATLVLSACAGTASIRSDDTTVTDDAGAFGATTAGGQPDAGTPGEDAGTPDAGPACGTTGAAWTCSADGTSRAQCVQGTLSTDPCAKGCLRPPPGTEAQCLGTPWTLSCSGSYGTTKSTVGDYYLTAFGCWTDAAGTVHTDPGDNCIPWCLAQARASGLCLPGDTGPQCEERVNWFTADGARFGCLARLLVTNPANGKKVVAVALDFGPSCTLERSVNSPLLDASGRVDRYLFGSDQGATDRATVHVVEVDPSTPLGPVP